MARIFILDDNEVLLAVAQASLEARGHIVTTRQSPLGFSAMLQEVRPELALIDVLMPALAGPRLVELIRNRSRGSDAPLLVLYSGILESELKRLVKECGADGYFVKSRLPSDLPMQVARFLADRSSKRSSPGMDR